MYLYSDVQMILGQDCFHSIRPLENNGVKSRNSPFFVHSSVVWVLSGPLPSFLGLASHCFKCSVGDNSLVEQVKNWYELESYGTNKSADTLEMTISHDGTGYSVGML